MIPHPIDIHVGARMSLRRKETGLSQAALGAAMGVTFQQAQKYERGTNRLSASALWMASHALSVPISYFFDGLENVGPETPARDREMREYVYSPTAQMLIGAAMALPPKLVASFAMLMQDAANSLGLQTNTRKKAA